MDKHLVRQAELHLRLHLHALVPLHEMLVEMLCHSPAPPLELATALEDIGQAYMRMVEALNGQIIASDRLDDEPEDPDDFAEARIAQFAADLTTAAGLITFSDGVRVDGRAALENFPVAEEAIKAAVVQALGRRSPALLRSRVRRGRTFAGSDPARVTHALGQPADAP